jgi:hypothetical protein
VLGRMLALHRYRSFLASMEVTVVSAESDHDAFQCSDSKCYPTACREESCCFNFLYTALQTKLLTVLSEAWSYSVHPSFHGMCCYCFAAPFSFLRKVSRKRSHAMPPFSLTNCKFCSHSLQYQYLGLVLLRMGPLVPLRVGLQYMKGLTHGVYSIATIPMETLPFQAQSEFFQLPTRLPRPHFRQSLATVV